MEFICRHDRTAEVCRAAVEEDGWQLENVPEEMKTPELCRKALETEAGFGNDFHRGLVQHIPFVEVCMEVLSVNIEFTLKPLNSFSDNVFIVLCL